MFTILKNLKENIARRSTMVIVGKYFVCSVDVVGGDADRS